MTSVFGGSINWARHTQEQHQRPYEIYENPEVPGIQDLTRGWEGQEVVVDNSSTSESGVAAMYPMGTSGTDMTPNSPNIFELAVAPYGFDHLVFDEGNGDGVDTDVSDNDDDPNFEIYDEENEENVPPVAQTHNREGKNHPHSAQLRRSQGVPFQRLEIVPESVIRSFFE